MKDLIGEKLNMLLKLHLISKGDRVMCQVMKMQADHISPNLYKISIFSNKNQDRAKQKKASIKII